MRRFVETRKAIVRLACELEDDGTERVLGFAVAHIQVSRRVVAAYIVTLDVLPEARSKGIGHRLMASVEGEAFQAGAGLVWLHVHVDNAPAKRLYEQLVYERVGEQTDFYGTGLHAEVYRKVLDGGEDRIQSDDEGNAACVSG